MAESMEVMHRVISSEAKTMLRSREHSFRDGVSSHRGPSITFQNTSQFLSNIKRQAKVGADKVFLSTIDGEMNVSVAFNYKKEAVATTGKKRSKSEEAARSELDQKIEDALERIRSNAKKLNGQKVDEETLMGAKQSLHALLTQLKGPEDEEVVESWGLHAASPTAIAVGRPSLVLSLRISAGIPVPVSVLRRSLGRSFNDGAVTSDQRQPENYALPITEQGAAILRHGQTSMLIHANVAAC